MLLLIEPKMPHFEVELDRATGKGAGSGGIFQVVSITGESCVDRTSLIEKSKQYANLHELLVDIARAVSKGVGDLTLEEV